MKKIFVKFSAVAIIALTVMLNVCISLKASEIIKEKVYLDLDINDDLCDNSVVVLLDKETSKKSINFKKEFFYEFTEDMVEDLTVNYKEGEHRIFKITLPINDKQYVIDIVKKLEGRDGFFCVSPDYKGKPSSYSLNQYINQWGITSNNGVKINEAWDLCQGHKSVQVGILDYGFAYNSELNYYINNPVDFSNDFNSGGYHGTIVSGIINVISNNTQTTTVDNRVKLVPLSIGKTGEISAIKAALEYCETKNIKIVNFSWGWLQ